MCRIMEITLYVTAEFWLETSVTNTVVIFSNNTKMYKVLICIFSAYHIPIAVNSNFYSTKLILIRCTIRIIQIQRRYTQCFVLYKTNEVYIYLMSVVLFTSSDN